jgi:hypothetical protein
MSLRSERGNEHRLRQRITLTCSRNHPLGTLEAVPPDNCAELYGLEAFAGVHWTELETCTARSASGALMMVCPRCRKIKPLPAWPFPAPAAVVELLATMRRLGPAHVTVQATAEAIRATARQLEQRGLVSGIVHRVYPTRFDTR